MVTRSSRRRWRRRRKRKKKMMSGHAAMLQMNSRHQRSAARRGWLGVDLLIPFILRKFRLYSINIGSTKMKLKSKRRNEVNMNKV